MSSVSDQSSQSPQGSAHASPLPASPSATPTAQNSDDLTPSDTTSCETDSTDAPVVPQLIAPRPPRISAVEAAKAVAAEAKSSHHLTAVAKPSETPKSEPLKIISVTPKAIVEAAKAPLAPKAEQPAPAPLEETSTSEERNQPIPPPSEPMQYRAIGLIRGKYTPSEEQFTRGNLVAMDGTELNAVLLGRVMSLVKKHLDLATDHLWVVYPRTREDSENLHVQIVGVWEPERLQRHPEEETGTATAANLMAANIDSSQEAGNDGDQDNHAVEAETMETEMSESDAAETVTMATDTITAEAPVSFPVPPTPAVISTGTTTTSTTSTEEFQDGYFSIRGEIVFQSQEKNRVVVKIKQTPRKNAQQAKAFKLELIGELGPKALKHFWELHVMRQANTLVIQEGRCVGVMPPKKRRGGSPVKRPSRAPMKRSLDHARPTPANTAANGVPSGQPASNRKKPLPKPVKRNRPSGEPTEQG